MLEFGAEKRLLQRLSKKNGWLVLKRPELSYGFMEEVLQAKVWGSSVGCVTGNRAVTGWWFGKLHHQPSAFCAQPEVRAWTLTTVLLSLLFMMSFSCWAVSDPLRPHGPQHTRLPCPSLPAGVCSNSCPLSRWCHPTISSSVAPFSCLPSFQHRGLF